MRNLCEKTKLKIMDLELNKVEKIKKYLINIEKNLIHLIEERINSNLTNKMYQMKITEEATPSKWCELHKSKTHSNEDCRFQSKQNEVSNSKRQDDLNKSKKIAPLEMQIKIY